MAEKDLPDLTGKKVKQLTEVMEKFGMDFITKLGKLSFQIKKLTDKVNDLSKATLDIKALTPKLNNVIENQKDLRKDMQMLKSLIYKNKKGVSQQTTPTTENISKVNKKNLILSDLSTLKNTIRSQEDFSALIETLSSLKEKIFEFTGGSRILYDLSQIIKELKREQKITSDIREQLVQNTDEWKKKI